MKVLGVNFFLKHSVCIYIYIYIFYKFFAYILLLTFQWGESGGIAPWRGWLTIVLQCYDTVGCIIWPAMSSRLWNDVQCVEQDVKPYYTIPFNSTTSNINFSLSLTKFLQLLNLAIFATLSLFNLLAVPAPHLLSLFLAPEPSPPWKSQIAHLVMHHLVFGINFQIHSVSLTKSPFSSRFTSSSTSQLISVIISVNVLISPTVTCHIAGCCHLENSMTWSQSHVSHCRVLPPGKFWMWHCVSVWASGEEDCMKSVGSIRWIQKLQEASVWCPELLRCRCRTRCGDVHGTPEVHCLLHMQERLWQCVNLWQLMALFSQYSCLLGVVRLNNIILPCKHLRLFEIRLSLLNRIYRHTGCRIENVA